MKFNESFVGVAIFHLLQMLTILYFGYKGSKTNEN